MDVTKPCKLIWIGNIDVPKTLKIQGVPMSGCFADTGWMALDHAHLSFWAAFRMAPLLLGGLVSVAGVSMAIKNKY